MMIATVTSYAFVHPNIAGDWIAANKKAKFATEARLFEPVSGLSLLFFTAASGTPQRYTSQTTLAWSL